MTAAGRTADAVIIGAGVIGSAIAYELAKRGLRTVNVDRLPAAGYGPTANSCAIVRAHYSSLHGVALAYEGFFYWERWPDYVENADERGPARYVRCGTILFKGGSGHHEKVLGHYRALGVEFEDWDLETLGAHAPYYDLHSFWPPSRPEDDSFWTEPTRELTGAIFTPGSGYVTDPQLATHNLQRAAEAHGASFLFRRSVVGIRRNSRVVGVTLDGGEQINAPVVVNVAGPHSACVNELAGQDVVEGMRVQTRPLRHEVHVVPAPDGVDFEHAGSHISDGDQGIYFRPETGNRILVGSEDPACDPRVWLYDPDVYYPCGSRAKWEAQVFRLARRLPGLPIPSEAKGVVDLYDVSDDWMPIYDRSDLDGYYMAIGTSGNQFKNAGPVGYLMASLIESCENGLDHDRAPLHVRLEHTGLDLDLGCFSRQREVDPNSSFSVIG